MEEQRIGAMYLNLLRGGLARFWGGLFPRGLRRSAALPWLVIGLLIGIPGLGWQLHRLGRFHALKSEMNGESRVAPSGPNPGGVAPIVLTRTATAGGALPEFLSVTMLPGLGMEVLQITAFIPHRGEIALLASPSLQAMADGTTGPRAGADDLRGALEVPWGGAVGGVISPLGTTIATSWKGQTIEVPTDTQGHGAVSEGGMLSRLGVDSSQVSADGMTASGNFKATNFQDHWPSRSDVNVTVQLDAGTIILTVDVKNVGVAAEPMGVGWRPRFVIPSGRRNVAELRLPNGERLEIGDRVKAMPSGRIVPAGTALERFQGHPAPLGIDSLNETLVQLKPSPLDNGVAAETRDPAAGFGLRMTALSETVKALHINAPASDNYVSLGMQTNYDDPLGREWVGGEGPGIVTLEPGRTLEWKIRLDIFPIARGIGSTR